VRTDVHDPPVVHDDDAVSVTNGRDAVRDRDEGPLVRRLVDRADECTLRRAVQGGRSLVEHEDGRFSVERARDRDALSLAAGEADAALADDRVETVRQRRDDGRELGTFDAARRVGPRRPRSRPSNRTSTLSRSVASMRNTCWDTTPSWLHHHSRTPAELTRHRR
jgi:hypothetical protein